MRTISPSFHENKRDNAYRRHALARYMNILGGYLFFQGRENPRHMLGLTF